MTPTHRSDPSGPAIAIVGAGLAGLSCAAALQAAGRGVVLFEKSRGPAGRMSTRNGDDWQCDFGAQYFVVRDPSFRDEVQRWTDAGVAQLWQPRLSSFVGRAWKPTRTALARHVGVPAMTAPAHWLARGLEVRSQATVQPLVWTEGGWKLQFAEPGIPDAVFGSVLLAVPAPQAQALLGEHAPGLGVVAGRAGMQACWSLMLRFDAPVPWELDAAFVNQGPLRWMARDTSKPGRPRHETWVLHATAEWSHDHLEDDPADVARAMLKAFADLGGPAPAAWTAHRWRYATNAPPLTEGCAWDAAAGLGLCGDWLHGGKVEGAWLSGQALARRVLQQD